MLKKAAATKTPKPVSAAKKPVAKTLLAKTPVAKSPAPNARVSTKLAKASTAAKADKAKKPKLMRDSFTIPKAANFRLFAPELGGGALLDLGVYPVSFASMILGTPSRIVAMVDPSFNGVDGQSSMLFGYANGAQAVLTCTSSARSATRASIVGTEARIEIEGDFYAPTSFSLIRRDGDLSRFEFVTVGRGLHYQAAEVARCMARGEIESRIMPLDESISIMETMEIVLTHL